MSLLYDVLRSRTPDSPDKNFGAHRHNVEREDSDDDLINVVSNLVRRLYRLGVKIFFEGFNSRNTLYITNPISSIFAYAVCSFNTGTALPL
jgi:hypothetical protein